MKKIYSFIALMLLLFTGNVQAQRAWDLADEPAKEISTDKYYVIQEGSYGTWSESKFLGVNGMVANAETSAIFQFVQVDEKEAGGEVFPIYILKSVDNGLYLANANPAWVKSKNSAWRFGARIAVDKDLPEDATWYDWSNAIQGVHSDGSNRNADSDGIAFVFAEDNDESVVYMNYVGEPGFMSYWDTNDWFVYEASERELSEYEKFIIVYEQYFTNPVTEEFYPVGTAPGCVSQEIFNQLVEAEKAANEAYLDDAQPAEYYQKVREQIEAAFKAYNEGVCPVTPGYYLLVNQRSQDAAFDNGTHAACTLGMAAPEEWNLNTAKYIWEVVAAEKEDTYYFKNFGTGRYLGAGPGTSQQYPTTENADVYFTSWQYKGAIFIIQDQNGNMTHCAGHGPIVVWNDATGAGTQWKYVKVADDIISNLKGEVEKIQLMAKLESALAEAKSTAVKYVNKNGLTYDDTYEAAGLVPQEAMSTNSPENGEGYAVEDQFKRMTDGNLTTYFHTSWSEEAPADDWHWIQVDLGKEVQKLTIKMTQRHNNRNGNPAQFSLVTCEDVASAVWDDTLRNRDTIVYGYKTNFPSGAIDSTTAIIENIDLGRPVQHLRFVVHRTKANQIYGGGPCWHVSEIRFFEDLGRNPLYDLIPQNVKDELNAAIAAGEKEMADSAATQATIDRLNDAVEAFLEAYPNPAGLENLIEEAEAQLEAADDSQEEIGYFQPGAKNELQGVIDAVKKEIDGKYLTLDELAKYEKQIQDALKAFAGKLIKPAPGIYRIISTSINEETGEDRDQTGSYLAATVADLKATPTWGYKANVDDEYATRWSLLWEVSVNEAGELALRNLATGRYLNNKFAGLDEEATSELMEEEGRTLDFSATPVYFAMQSAKVAGEFNFILNEGQFMNFDPVGVVVAWGDPNDVNARFTFETVEDLEEEYFTVDVTPNKLNVFTMPIDIVAESYGENQVMKVLGRAEEATADEDGIEAYDLYLGEYDTEEIIPAGTPFFYQAGADESYISFIHATASSLEDLTDLTYGYEGKVQNGLMGVISACEVPAGYGLINSNEILVSEEGDEVAAGKAFFAGANDIEVNDGSEAVVTLRLPIEVVGKSTAIENVVVMKEAAKGVYAISGVKVRNNNNTNGLPKGLYIVGGKKVLVK